MAAPAGGGPATRRRLDQVLVERGLADNRTRAQALVMAGLVWSGDQRLDKPGQSVGCDLPIEVRGRDHPWVSRGGIKLAHALDTFAIDAAGLVSLDVGASTGGFTDVLLSRGAARVYAVDVGHGQLDWRLRQDSRVVVLERTNVRHLNASLVPEPVLMIVCDVSFIGLETALPAAIALAGPGCTLVTLIKPQFEVGRDQVGKKGVVRDPILHEAVKARIRAWMETQPGWRVEGIVESPITGPEGNREFLLVARKATD